MRLQLAADIWSQIPEVAFPEEAQSEPPNLLDAAAVVAAGGSQASFTAADIDVERGEVQALKLTISGEIKSATGGGSRADPADHITEVQGIPRQIAQLEHNLDRVLFKSVSTRLYSTEQIETSTIRAVPQCISSATHIHWSSPSIRTSNRSHRPIPSLSSACRRTSPHREMESVLHQQKVAGMSYLQPYFAGTAEHGQSCQSTLLRFHVHLDRRAESDIFSRQRWVFWRARKACANPVMLQGDRPVDTSTLSKSLNEKVDTRSPRHAVSVS